MFRLTSKVKIAAGLAAGALTLGAAGAYAANANNNGTIPVSNLKPVAVTGDAGGLTLNPTQGKMTALTIPAAIDNLGQCCSLFPQQLVLGCLLTADTARISKNFHGKV